MPVGWAWRTHVQQLYGGEWCEARHAGVMIAGRFAWQLMDGTVNEFAIGDLFDVPPGHVGWTVGDEDAVSLEWAGLRRWVVGARTSRVLASLLFTDIVDSTKVASRLGDADWHDLLSVHYHQAHEAIERYGGRQVATTGDGVLATFDAAAAAVRCAIQARVAAQAQGLDLRLGVHVGEIDLAGNDIRGVTVHEAARVMSAAGPGEILVSEQVQLLCRGSDFTFEDAGEHVLKGVPERWHLFRVVT